MKMFALVVLSFALSMLPQVAQAQTPARIVSPTRPPKLAMNCGVSHDGGWDLNYCFEKNSESQQLLVFMPGVFNGADRLRSHYFIFDEMSRLHIARPNILTLSFGAVNFLADQDGRTVQAAADAVSKIVSQFQTQTGAGRVKLLGDSMGGFNGMQIFLRSPERFAKVALICPALVSKSPFSDEWDTDPDTLAANTLYRFALRKTLEWTFATEHNWLISSPLSFLDTLQVNSARASATAGQVYFATVENDEYGFLSAVENAARNLQALGYVAEHQRTPHAHHCYPQAEPVVNFLFADQTN